MARRGRKWSWVAVTLEVSSLVVAVFLTGCAAGGLVFPSEPKPGTVFHSFMKPDGPGPFPAVVLLHTCGGVGRHMPGWAVQLLSIGYASVIVDSLTPRGGTACWAPTYYPATLDQVTEDAFAALAWLRGRSDIDPERIGVMGFSYGASATLRTSSASYRKNAPGGGFRAAAAYYPVCVSPRADWPAAARERSNNLFDDIATPTLILMGADDTDTPNVAQNCANKVAYLAGRGRPITIHMYPNANHVFDVRQPAAAARAFGDLQAFFARHLGSSAAVRVCDARGGVRGVETC